MKQEAADTSALAAFDIDGEESGEAEAPSPHRSGPHLIGKIARKANEPRVGSVFAGRYRVVRHIANGGMGAVWEAEDTSVTPTQQIALKVLTQWGEIRDEARERFRRETALASGLVGEQFARMFGHGIEGDVPYIALELFDGETLHDRLDGCALTPAETLEILRQAAQGLDIAHSFGIVHRDISPKNLFLVKAEEGATNLKILDFGIAKHGLFDSKLTEPGTLMGSLQYMSPEQVRSASAADASSDLWSLAVVIYRCLLGRHPFQGEAGPLLIAITSQEHPPPSSIAPKLGSAVDEFFATALAKDCRQRFRTGEVMFDAFQKAIVCMEAEPPLPVSISIPPPFGEARATVLARASYAEFAEVVSRGSQSDAPTADGAPNPLILEGADPSSREAITTTDDDLRALRAPRVSRTWLLAAVAVVLLVAAILLLTLPEQQWSW